MDEEEHFVCYNCKEDYCQSCVGVPCHCGCPYGLMEADVVVVLAHEWLAAKNHFDTVLAARLSGEPSAATIPALKIIFEPLLRRYLSGERSGHLLAAMRSVE